MVARILCVAAVLAPCLVGSVVAQTWDGGGAAGGSLNWSVGTNWNPDGVPVNNGTANIIMAGTIDTTNTVDVNFDINSLTFNNTAGAFVINNSGGATLTIRGGGITDNDASTQTINAPLILGAGQTRNANAGALVIGGTLNLGTNQLIVTGAATASINGVIQNTSGSIVKNGSGTLILANNHLFSGGVMLNAGTLIVSNSGNVGTGVLTLNAGTIRTSDSPITLNNAVTLGGNFDVGFSVHDLNFGLAATLTGNRTITIVNNNTTFAGAIGQDLPGRSLTKSGMGNLIFSGASPNTYTGTTTVTEGNLFLSKSVDNGAILGDLVIGDGMGGGVDSVFVNAANQIANTANVTINDGAVLALAASEDGFGLLTLNGGTVQIDPMRSLTLTNNVVVNDSASMSMIAGLNQPLVLSGARTFTVNDDGLPETWEFETTTSVQGGTLVKEGLGAMRLTGSANNSAALTVNAGTVIAAKTSIGVASMTGSVVIGDGIGASMLTSCGSAITNKSTKPCPTQSPSTVPGCST
jgi:autotransporter-associated beta strand protein